MTIEENAWPDVHSVGDIAIQAGFVLGTRTIPDYELVYFPEGTGTLYEIEGKSIRLDKPCVVFTRPDVPHRYRFDPQKNVRHLFAHFDYGPLRLQDPRFASLRSGCDVLPVANSLLPGIVAQMLRVANRQSPHWKRRMAVLLAAALEELCAWAESSPASPAASLPLPIANAIAYMENRLAEPLTIEAIARQSGWSHEHFTRVFVSAVGTSPKRALLERRLMRAERLMMGGQMTVKQIAYEVGFRDEHHFSKMYKRIRGLSASDYIKQCEDPLFRHTAQIVDPETPYPLNCHIVVNGQIK
ncbi:AraC family transcriptional regulator [Cohnella nanjingensis]|uniref:Helix-turn-helix transcriptional regulator n=1 Tax=Cohnella nanjingensis TaxID=1387779 RepID=A0A7X0VFW7_9BACL|nr:AraC family transcriptional regulator [Cohnella nanjingensis]MBB6672487.1 helix-turn-helix transcriptional regulator [Cohnella nanjingensis]